ADGGLSAAGPGPRSPAAPHRLPDGSGSGEHELGRPRRRRRARRRHPAISGVNRRDPAKRCIWVCEYVSFGKGVSMNDELMNALVAADLARAEELLRRGAQINARDEIGDSALAHV